MIKIINKNKIDEIKNEILLVSAFISRYGNVFYSFFNGSSIWCYISNGIYELQVIIYLFIYLFKY